MSPITHFLVGWALLERRVSAPRDKALVCLAGVAPDLDGLGLLVDALYRALGSPATRYYEDYHRLFGHSLPAALLLAALVAVPARQRLRVAVLGLVAVHLHLLCDLLGSRGSTPLDLWPIWYLAPFSLTPEWSVSWQWPLVGWQNLLLSAALLFITLRRGAVTGYTPLTLLAPRVDRAVVEVLRRWGGRARTPERGTR